MTLKTAGTPTVTATDTVTGSITEHERRVTFSPAPPRTLDGHGSRPRSRPASRQA